MRDRLTIGIYAYSTGLRDSFGGVETFSSHLARALADRGYRVIFHALAGQNAGWHATSEGFRLAGTFCQRGLNLFEFQPVNGPGLSGAVLENLEISREQDEGLALIFGTRDGFVFDLGLAVAAARPIPAVSFIAFTVEERSYRAQFASRTRSIPGRSDPDEEAALRLDGVAVLRRIVTLSAAVVVPTHFVRGQLTSLFGAGDLTRCSAIYHGVDSTLFSPRTLPWNADGSWLHVSRLTVPFACQKNFFWSCEAFVSMAKELAGSTIEFVGGGSAAQLITEFAVAHALGDRISNRGLLDQAALVARYQSASFLLAPSMMEAGATSIVEAVMCGALPIALEFAGSAEIMDRLGLSPFLLPGVSVDRGTGVCSVEPEPGAFVDAVQYARLHQDEVQSLLATAREEALQTYSLAVATQRLEALIEKVASA